MGSDWKLPAAASKGCPVGLGPPCICQDGFNTLTFESSGTNPPGFLRWRQAKRSSARTCRSCIQAMHRRVPATDLLGGERCHSWGEVASPSYCNMEAVALGDVCSWRLLAQFVQGKVADSRLHGAYAVGWAPRLFLIVTDCQLCVERAPCEQLSKTYFGLPTREGCLVADQFGRTYTKSLTAVPTLSRLRRTA